MPSCARRGRGRRRISRCRPAKGGASPGFSARQKCFGPGGPGQLSAQGSHRPVRAHIRAYGSPTNGFATREGPPKLFDQVTVTCSGTSMCSACFPRSSLLADASLSSTGSSEASSPASTVLSKRYDFLPPIPPHFVAFVWRYLRVHSFVSLLSGRVRRQGLELFTRWLHPGMLPRKRQDLPSSWGTQCPFAHIQSTPAGLLVPDHFGTAAWPLACEKQRLPRKGFRSSIAWLSNSLSTLRRTGYPVTTQDSLPAAGQALPGGLLPTGFLRKVSELHPTSHPPFPSLLGAITSTEVASACPYRCGFVDLNVTRTLSATNQNVEPGRADYVAGRGDFLRLVTAQRQLIDVRENHQVAIAEYHARLADLEHAIGGAVPVEARLVPR